MSDDRPAISLRSKLIGIGHTVANCRLSNENDLSKRRISEERVSDQRRTLLLGNPQSLLARDPMEVSQTLSIPITQVHRIRRHISESIIMDRTVGHGTDSKRMIEDLLVLENEYKNVGDHDAIYNRQNPSMVGGTTALDKILHSSTSSMQDSTSVISTGSTVLNNLLSPPPATFHTAFTNIHSDRKKRPRSQISNMNTNTTTDTNNTIPKQSPITNKKGKKVKKAWIQSGIQSRIQSGFVTEISGPSVKQRVREKWLLAVSDVPAWACQWTQTTNNNTNTNTAMRIRIRTINERFYRCGFCGTLKKKEYKRATTVITTYGIVLEVVWKGRRLPVRRGTLFSPTLKQPVSSTTTHGWRGERPLCTGWNTHTTRGVYYVRCVTSTIGTRSFSNNTNLKHIFTWFRISNLKLKHN